MPHSEECRHRCDYITDKISSNIGIGFGLAILSVAWTKKYPHPILLSFGSFLVMASISKAWLRNTCYQS
jgi:hypothetical protein